jgi:hypothetical protein
MPERFRGSVRQAPTMPERLVNVDRETPLLLPANLRKWVPEDDRLPGAGARELRLAMTSQYP